MRNTLKICKVNLFAVLALTACEQPKPPRPLPFKSSGKVNYNITPEEELMLDSIQQKTFLFLPE